MNGFASKSLMFQDSILVIFAKAPQPGQVKTRLFPIMSPVQAARLHAYLLDETLKLTHRQALCRVQLCCSPNPDYAEFKAAARHFGVDLDTQSGKDLGERMQHAIGVNLLRYSAVVLIGCDSPSLTIADLIEVFSALRRGVDVALGPAEDGGYVLIGMTRAHPELFKAMPWGSEQVLAKTRNCIRRLGLTSYETRLQWDIDRPEDWQRYLSCNDPKPFNSLPGGRAKISPPAQNE